MRTREEIKENYKINIVEDFTNVLMGYFHFDNGMTASIIIAFDGGEARSA